MFLAILVRLQSLQILHRFLAIFYQLYGDRQTRLPQGVRKEKLLVLLVLRYENYWFSAHARLFGIPSRVIPCGTRWRGTLPNMYLTRRFPRSILSVLGFRLSLI